MSIEKVRVQGFRLLEDVEISLESTSTLIVGRNNSGKTSLTDVFERIVGESGPKFRLQDFSAGTRKRFLDAHKLRTDGEKLEAVLSALPKISITITFKYDVAAVELGPLSPFIIDLDPNSSSAIALIEYAAELGTIQTLFDFPETPTGTDPNVHFYRCLKDTLGKAYTIQVSAIDPTDETNRRLFEGSAQLSALMQCNLVRAQRTLDHAKHGDADVIGKVLTTLFKTANASTAAVFDQQLAAKLKASVESIQNDVQNDFDEMLKALLPALEVFGFPSLNDTELRPETSLNVEALLSDHTKIVYTGADGVHLPEGYNGLGTRNLIYMLLQLETFHKAYRATPTRPATHLIFIEEPEAHLHPQMQEVLIAQLNQAVSKLSAKYPTEPVWKVQFVITTHSSHVANAADFDAVRYFLNDLSKKDNLRRTKVKDFKKGTTNILAADREFLHQYMTLTKCDLYFADKAIMVEGATERILMPRLCEIVDRDLPESSKLARQYVTTVEAGGAHAQLFYPLLDFLELKTLVITDLDTVKAVIKQNKKGEDVTRYEKCPVAEGERTSNTAIREWFRPQSEAGQPKPELPVLSVPDLMAKSEGDKSNGFRRIAYQIPEDSKSGLCARSYEDALVLANEDRFTFPDEDDRATEAWEIAKEMPKAETALRFAIEEKDWKVPRYIREGLVWLSEPPPAPAELTPVVVADEKVAVE